jgi:hypothetical protein
MNCPLAEAVELASFFMTSERCRIIWGTITPALLESIKSVQGVGRGTGEESIWKPGGAWL